MAEKTKKFNRSDYYKVEGVKPLFPLPFTTEPLPPGIANNPAAVAALSQPILEFKLEGDKTFRMSGIPTHVAVEIQQVLKEQEEEEEQSRDPRFSLSSLIREVIDIKRVKISEVLPELGVYLAEIDFKSREGAETIRSIDMIPSHALLAAIRGSSSIYVAKKLLKRSTYQQREKEEERRKEEDWYYV